MITTCKYKRQPYVLLTIFSRQPGPLLKILHALAALERRLRHEALRFPLKFNEDLVQ